MILGDVMRVFYENYRKNIDTVHGQDDSDWTG
jgi:hypothetical protein